MYSPKIKEDLIPYIYQIAKKRQIPMTRVVDEIIRDPVIQIAQQIEGKIRSRR